MPISLELILMIAVLCLTVVILAIVAPALALTLINAIERVLLAVLNVPRTIAQRAKRK